MPDELLFSSLPNTSGPMEFGTRKRNGERVSPGFEDGITRVRCWMPLEEFRDRLKLPAPPQGGILPRREGEAEKIARVTLRLSEEERIRRSMDGRTYL